MTTYTSCVIAIHAYRRPITQRSIIALATIPDNHTYVFGHSWNGDKTCAQSAESRINFDLDPICRYKHTVLRCVQAVRLAKSHKCQVVLLLNTLFRGTSGGLWGELHAQCWYTGLRTTFSKEVSFIWSLIRQSLTDGSIVL
jgi:hypothetical protein